MDKASEIKVSAGMKNLPNRITISRVFLIFLFVILANLDDTNPNCIRVSASTAYICHVLAYLIAIFAGLTDLLDGYIARKYHLESDFGRLIDPLADKIFILATFSMMVDYQFMPGWILIVILAREFMVTGLRTLATAKGVVISADKWGKLKTALQMTTLGIGGASWIHLFGFSVEYGPMKGVWLGLLILVALVTVASGFGYFVKHKKLYLESAL